MTAWVNQLGLFLCYKSHYRKLSKKRELQMANITDPENTIIIELKDGNVTIELLADIAPKHVARMKELARSG